jgi:hypothetical protein
MVAGMATAVVRSVVFVCVKRVIGMILVGNVGEGVLCVANGPGGVVEIGGGSGGIGGNANPPAFFKGERRSQVRGVESDLRGLLSVGRDRSRMAMRDQQVGDRRARMVWRSGRRLGWLGKALHGNADGYGG